MSNVLSRLKDRRGFSLFELVITVLITTIIAGAIISMLFSQIQLSTTQNRNIINQQNLRDALEFMGDEISNAGSHSEEPFFTLASSSDIEFVGDQDGDGSPDKVHYYVNGSTLYRDYYTTLDGGATWDLQSTDVIIDNVLTLTFTYYAYDNVAPLDTSEITSVKIELEINKAMHTTAYTNGKVAAQAQMRRVTVRNRLL